MSNEIILIFLNSSRHASLINWYITINYSSIFLWQKKMGKFLFEIVAKIKDGLLMTSLPGEI